MDYNCVIINLPVVLFHLGERVKNTAVIPYKIMGHPAWYRYISGTASPETALQQIAGSFNTTAQQVADTVNAMCTDTILDNEVLIYLKQAKKAGKKLYGIITIAQREYDIISRKHAFDAGLFDQLFYLSECSGGSLTPGFFSKIVKAVQQRPSRTIYIDRKLEAINICSTVGMLPLYLDRHNHFLKLIMPKEHIIAALNDFLYTEFPHTYNRTAVKHADTLEDKGRVTESYTACWIWSLFPDILPDAVKDKLRQLGDGMNRILFFEDKKDVERHCNLPFDIDTMSIYTSVMYEHKLMQRDVAEKILTEILDNVNDSGFLMVYFDKNRPRVDAIAILNCIYLAYLLNREDEPVIRQNELFIEKILLNGGWEYGTFYFVLPTAFLLAVFRVVSKFKDRAPANFREGMEAALHRKMGVAATPLELGIRLLISQWLNIPNPEDMRNLLVQRTDTPGFQWLPSPLYKVPSVELHYFNPLFDAAVIKIVLEAPVISDLASPQQDHIPLTNKHTMMGKTITAPAASQLADQEKRTVHLQGAVNFRDVGGYATKDGRKVKWDKVFRSGTIHRLSQQDLAVLSQKNIRTVIDFRTLEESQQAPDQLLPGTDYILCPAGSLRMADTKQLVRLVMEGSFLPDFYADIQYLGERYKPLFGKLMALPENEALLFHCSGGRDRTGIATALFLYALDVPQETIEADYTLSNRYLQSMYGHLIQQITQEMGIVTEALVNALELKPALIRATFNAIVMKYGSMAAFFQQELDLGKQDIALLKEKYTA